MLILKVILTVAALLLAIFSFCCLRVASREDRWLDAQWDTVQKEGQENER